MGFDDRAIDAVLVMRADDGRQIVEDRFPQAFLCPSHKAVIDGFGGTVFRRAIAPAAARLQHMDDPADNPPIIFASRSALVLRQMFFQHRPLQIVQPEQIASHGLLLHGHAQPPSPYIPLNHQSVNRRLIGSAS